MRAVKVAALARAAVRPSAARVMSGTPTYTGTVYKESEKARENAFFSKQDEMALRKLLTKVKSSADASCTTAGAHSAKEEAALQAIVAKYKLDAKDMEGAHQRRKRRNRRLPRGRCRGQGLVEGLRSDRAFCALTRRRARASQR